MKKDRTTLYIAIAAGVTLVLGIMYLMATRKRKETFVPKVSMKRYVFPKRETFVTKDDEPVATRPSSYEGCVRPGT